jgi:hypothetical protein
MSHLHGTEGSYLASSTSDQGKHQRPLVSSQGYAAGEGNVHLKEDPKTFAYDSRGHRLVRAGQWKLCRVGRHIEVEQVMDTDGAKSVRLCYKDCRPTEMLMMVYTRLWFFELGAYRQWKTPSRVGQRHLST